MYIHSFLCFLYFPITQYWKRLKWKPPSENSIDFKLVLRFPPMRNDPNKPDLHAKPLFLLHTWLGDERGQAKYEQYDDMYVEDEEWEK